LFFGRNDEIEELTSLVLSTSAVLIYAQSGSGKSSLLEAGLGPSLEGLGYRVPKAVHCNQASVTLTDDETSPSPQNPFTELVYRTVLPEGALPSDRRDLMQLAACLRETGRGKATLLILDQFEEIFANQALWRERGEFLAQLRGVLEANTWLRAILAIRSDYLASLLPHERDLPGQMLIRYELESLGEPAAREAIGLAFETTGVPLADDEMDSVLDSLLSLDVGPSEPPAKGQYVSLIQLQILCRRLWQAKNTKKTRPGTRSDADAPDGSQVLQDSKVDLADYIQSFISDEVANVAHDTQSDEGAIRRWLEDRLITTGGRRGVLLVDTEQEAGLPLNVLDELEKARLIEIEQRNQSRYAELTHDSMVAAVQESNKKWAGESQGGASPDRETLARPGGRTRLFVSYARTDRPEVDSLAQRLRQVANEVWFDADLVGGQVWWDNILNQIRDSDAFIAIVSRSSLKSQACRIERQYAARLGKPILPLAIEPLSAGTLPSDISRLQIVDYSQPDEDTAYALIGAIIRLPAPPPVPVPLPEPPDVPSSYWGNIGDQLNAQSLTLDQQFAIIGHLEGALAPTADPAEIPVAVDLLSQLEQRVDLYAAVERRVALLKQSTGNRAVMRSQASEADPLAKLADIRARGEITAQEYETEKANILAERRMSAADPLAKLADIRAMMVITAQEYETEKANILGGRRTDVADRLADLVNIRDRGEITLQEYEAQKASILA
jgi:hypothetical protein